MKSKKSQIQMAENVGILVIFFVLIVVGFVFYAKIQKESVKFESVEKRSVDALVTSQRIVNLPEIQCSEPLETESGRQDCVDIHKLDIFSDPTKYQTDIGFENFNSFYFDIFGYSNVTVREIYPLEQEWTLYYNKQNVTQSKLPVPVPILLYDELDGTYRFALLVVEVFS